MISSSRSMLYRFLILYGLLYAGFGVQSPYLPILLDNRHLRPETIALALAAGTAMRLMAAQAVARLADRGKPTARICPDNSARIFQSVAMPPLSATSTRRPELPWSRKQGFVGSLLVRVRRGRGLENG